MLSLLRRGWGGCKSAESVETETNAVTRPSQSHTTDATDHARQFLASLPSQHRHRHTMTSTQRPIVFMDVNIGETPAGRLKMELFSDVVPKYVCSYFGPLLSTSLSPIEPTSSGLRRISDSYARGSIGSIRDRRVIRVLRSIGQSSLKLNQTPLRTLSCLAC